MCTRRSVGTGQRTNRVDARRRRPRRPRRPLWCGDVSLPGHPRRLGPRGPSPSRGRRVVRVHRPHGLDRPDPPTAPSSVDALHALVVRLGAAVTVTALEGAPTTLHLLRRPRRRQSHRPRSRRPAAATAGGSRPRRRVPPPHRARRGRPHAPVVRRRRRLGRRRAPPIAPRVPPAPRARWPFGTETASSRREALADVAAVLEVDATGRSEPTVGGTTSP